MRVQAVFTGLTMSAAFTSGVAGAAVAVPPEVAALLPAWKNPWKLSLITAVDAGAADAAAVEAGAAGVAAGAVAVEAGAVAVEAGAAAVDAGAAAVDAGFAESAA